MDDQTSTHPDDTALSALERLVQRLTAELAAGAPSAVRVDWVHDETRQPTQVLDMIAGETQ